MNMDDSYPQVLISTADDPVPVIAEREGAFGPADAALWRPATDDEYARYYDYYTGGPGDPESHRTGRWVVIKDRRPHDPEHPWQAILWGGNGTHGNDSGEFATWRAAYDAAVEGASEYGPEHVREGDRTLCPVCGAHRFGWHPDGPYIVCKGCAETLTLDDLVAEFTVATMQAYCMKTFGTTFYPGIDQEVAP